MTLHWIGSRVVDPEGLVHDLRRYTYQHDQLYPGVLIPHWIVELYNLTGIRQWCFDHLVQWVRAGDLPARCDAVVTAFEMDGRRGVMALAGWDWQCWGKEQVEQYLRKDLP